MAAPTKNGQRKKAINSDIQQNECMVSDRTAVRGTRGATAYQTASKKSRKAKGSMATKTKPTKNTKGGKADAALEDKGRVQALDRALSQIDKAFGSGAIMRLSGDDCGSIPAISTGAISL
ncbi:MAG: hypothetical protein QF444_06585, partial [Phycisphaerales bacterium]|nr:hypothetical protein [Phycisphaerales bacterium]